MNKVQEQKEKGEAMKVNAESAEQVKQERERSWRPYNSWIKVDDRCHFTVDKCLLKCFGMSSAQSYSSILEKLHSLNQTTKCQG